MDGQCAKCPYQNTEKICREPEGGKHPEFCSTTLYQAALSDAAAEYENPDVRAFAAEASRQEISCYAPVPDAPDKHMPTKPRIVEIIEFCRRMGYERVGLAFCGGLHKEAERVCRILESAGLSVVSVMCKTGGADKTCLGLAWEEKINHGTAHETMCNPIGQAKILNAAQTRFNIVLGLCVGHDSLFFQYSDALCTVLAVKDRLAGHNPLAAIYTSDSYYRFLK